MNFFNGKKIIVGITGGIAAYKSCFLVRELIKLGAEVRVIMTPSAIEFVTPLTLSVLSGNEVIVNIFPASQKNGINHSTWHIEYGIWADLMIIAPATTNTIAKIVSGINDNALTTVVSALRAPLLVAPAADMDMYNNKIARENFKKLEEFTGAQIIEAESGSLASGLSGIGRMAEIDKIIEAAESVLTGYQKDLKGKKILVTAGPTFEDIDPVRFIGNRSSGKMGFEIAKAAFLRGADVTLITGPSSEKCYPEIKKINIRSAAEMKDAVDKYLIENEILIMSAAVADYKPANYADKKIKKEEGISSIQLSKTTDILSSVKKENKKIIGFALETDNELNNAKKKMSEKKLDMIVLNSLREEGSGFEFDTNKITIIKKEGEKKDFPLQSKFQTANKILSEILTLF